jgi:hypothetical protein
LARTKDENAVIDEMALVLFDHFNPHYLKKVNVGKSVCLKMAETALKVVAANYEKQMADLQNCDQE